MSDDLSALLAMPAGPVSDRHPALRNGGSDDNTGSGDVVAVSAKAMTEARALAELAGLPLVLVVEGTVHAVDETDLPWLPQDAIASLAASPVRSRPRAIESAADVDLTAVMLPSGHPVVALLPRVAGQPIPTDATIVAADRGWSDDQVAAWWKRRTPHAPGVAVRLLTLAMQAASADEQKGQLEWELESLADQIDSTYEEITLLHYLAQNLQQTHDTAKLAQLCLDRIGESLHALGGAAWLQVGEGNTHFLTEGDVPLDEFGLAALVGSFGGHAWPQPLVMNHVQSKFGPGSPEPLPSVAGLDNFVMVPVEAGAQHVGWLVCLNGTDGREFGTVEASLLASIAVTLGTHVQNAEAVREREEMLLSFVRSLVSSLDAKDPYTRGHSERVARIAAALARQLGDEPEDVSAIHLSGMLHDVGKIGLDDAVLCKPGHLTDAEFEQVKLHPTIGYQILGNIKSLSHILPGVRNHHESWDGSGYPDGLAGLEIPRQARILAVADSYDAMTSDRPYRNGMPLEKLQSIFANGRGTQWDPEVIDAYFAIADEVLELCEAWKRGE